MEKKVNNSDVVLQSAHHILENVNALLLSNANPSDDTSLSIRLSMIKVSKQLNFLYDFSYYLFIYDYFKRHVKKNLQHKKMI